METQGRSHAPRKQPSGFILKAPLECGEKACLLFVYKQLLFHVLACRVLTLVVNHWQIMDLKSECVKLNTGYIVSLADGLQTVNLQGDG